MSQICNQETLNALFAKPEQLVLDKVVSGLDLHTRKFIELCPFALLASQNQAGQMDLSPRGGKPGFIHILDDQTLLLPEYAGNDRIDTLKNLLANPQLGILCLLPGMGETLRLKGRANLFTPDHQNWQSYFSRPPKVIIEFKIEQLYFQCAAAVKLAKLWSSERQISRRDFPSIYQIIAEQKAFEERRKS